MPKPKVANKFIKPYVVVSGKKFRLKDHDPGETRITCIRKTNPRPRGWSKKA